MIDNEENIHPWIGNCKNCGEIIYDNINYCPKCGEKLKNNNELKPVRCRCGGKASVLIGVRKRYTYFIVQCWKCGIKVERKLKDEAIKVWNRVMDETDINVGCKFAKDINVPSKEQTANVEKVDMHSEHNKVYKCLNCGQYTHRTAWSSPVNYCTNCGFRLEWNE